MSELCNQGFSIEKLLSRVCNYVLESAESVDLERYGPYVDFLRRFFVPSIQPRILVLLEHFVYARDPGEPPPKELLGGVDPWLRASEALQELLRKEGLARIFLDSIVLSSRLDRINQELDRMGIERPAVKIDLTEACEWIDRCKSTLYRYAQPAASVPSNSVSEARQCRKRKATYEEEASPAASDSSANPLDSTSSLVPRRYSEDQTAGSSGSYSSSCSYCRLQRRPSGGETKPARSDKLRLVVTRVCQDDDCPQRRRTDYLSLPCDSRDLGEKVLQTARAPGLTTCTRKIEKLNQRLQNVCSRLNHVMSRMNDDALNDSSLSCDVRQNYIRFKLGQKNSKQCLFTTRIPVLKPYKKGLCNEKDDISKNDSKKDFEKTGCTRNKESPCKIVNDETISGGSATDHSTRFLWGEGGRSLATSSLDDNASCQDNEIFSSMCGENRKVDDSCPCSNRMEMKEKNNKEVENGRKCSVNSIHKNNQIEGVGEQNNSCKPEKLRVETKNNCNKTSASICSSKPAKLNEKIKNNCNKTSTGMCPPKSEKLKEKPKNNSNKTCTNKCPLKPEKLKEKTNINSSKTSKNICPPKLTKFKSIGVMTEWNPENRCGKQEITLKDAKIGPSDIEDDVELTNIYINEISLCCCDTKEETIKHVGINTECIEKDTKPPANVRIDISTNTERVQFRENSTQACFKEIQLCACGKKNPEEIEIENIKFDSQEVDYSCKCNKETSTDEKFVVLEVENEIPEKYACPDKTSLDEMLRNLSMLPDKTTDLKGIMKSKINEIVDINEKIREKITILKENTELCSVSVQTLTENKLCNSRDIEIQVKTSVISIKSNVNANTCSEKSISRLNSKTSEKSVMKSIKLCYDSSCTLKKPAQQSCPPLKKSILNEVTASLNDPVFQKIRHNFAPCDIIREDYPIKTMTQQSSCHMDNFAGGDASSCEEFYTYHGAFNSHNEHEVHRNCRCSQKSYFLNFLSDHLTRETFAKCKRVVHSVLQKILEKGRMLNELRKSSHRRARCHCTTVDKPVFEFRDECPRVSRTYTCRYEQTTRLTGGADRRTRRPPRRRRRQRRECKRECRAEACRDFENRAIAKSRRGYGQPRRAKRKRQKQDDYWLERSRRIEAFTASWDKPYDVYDVSSGSLPLSNKWKYR